MGVSEEPGIDTGSTGVMQDWAFDQLTEGLNRAIAFEDLLASMPNSEIAQEVEVMGGVGAGSKAINYLRLERTEDFDAQLAAALGYLGNLKQLTLTRIQSLEGNVLPAHLEKCSLPALSSAKEAARLVDEYPNTEFEFSARIQTALVMR